MTAYYNEFDPYAAQWLRNLIDAGHIANGEVDERSIADVKPDDLKGFTQCHFFAGIGGWSLAARLAGWPDDRELWTGSAPCQPFSTAGNQKGQSDERHLWPKFFDLIRACKPTTIMGEQVSAAIRFGWLDGVSSDLEGEGYTTGSVIIPACAVNAPHRRDRLWFVGYTEHDGQSTTSQCRGDGEAVQHNSQGTNSAIELEGTSASRNVPVISMADTECKQSQRSISEYRTDSAEERKRPSAEFAGLRPDVWHGAEYLPGPDGKARRFEPSIRLLAHGVPARVGKLRAYGNAIVPQAAAEVIKAYMETRP